MEISLERENVVILKNDLYELVPPPRLSTPQPNQQMNTLTFEAFVRAMKDALTELENHYVSKVEALAVAHYNALVHHEQLTQVFMEKAERFEAFQLILADNLPNAEKLIRNGLIEIDVALEQVLKAGKKVSEISQEMEVCSKNMNDFKGFALLLDRMTRKCSLEVHAHVRGRSLSVSF